MSQYKYDEEGGQFLTFVLTFLLLVLVPLTWSLLTGATTRASISQSWFDKRGQKVSTIRSINRRSFTNPRISKTLVAVIAGWTLAAYLVQRVANAAANSSHTVYDPFHILGLATSATEKEIKKHYKRLSIKFHPDKIRLSANQTKESVESHYIELTKAYKALTDDTIRKNFELYGHPDGRQEMSMGIALPTWVVESQNNIWVLGAYGVVFGVLMPYLVARWWYGSRAKTKDGVYVSTAQTFFQYLREDTEGPGIISILAVCEEFQDAALDRKGKDANEAALKELEDQVRAKLKPFGPTWQLSEKHRSPSVRKALILLYAYLFRIDSKNASLNQQRYLAGATAERLLDGMLQISLAHNWLKTTKLIMDAIQCFVQAVPLCEDRRVAELLQLGGMQPANARQIVAKGGDAGRAGVQGFFALDNATRKSLAGVKAEQLDHMVKVAGDWPRLELVDAFFKVEGERLVTASAIVQFVIKVRTLPPKKDDVLLVDGKRVGSDISDGSRDIRSGVVEDGDAAASSSSAKPDANATGDSGKQPLGVARAPHFVTERKPNWWVLLADDKQNRVIVQPTKFSDIGPDKVRTYTVQFQAPPNAGLYTFAAQIKSDSYLGSDAARYVQLKVEDAAVLDEEDDGDVEDDISEPDEDTLAGQMAMMRGQKVKASPVHGGEGGDDEEEEDGEEVDDDEEDSDPSDSDTDEE